MGSFAVMEPPDSSRGNRISEPASQAEDLERSKLAKRQAQEYSLLGGALSGLVGVAASTLLRRRLAALAPGAGLLRTIAARP
jgi:hypothetical protein